MTLQGDLSTLDLADLLQNLERHARTGLLSIEAEEGRATRMYFRDGKLALLATDERPELVDVLVASGAVAPETVDEARRKRRRSKKSLGETLVAMGAIERDALVELARHRLLGDVCEVMGAGGGAFTFEQGPVPRAVFDPEERRLELAIPVGPMLLEAARRADHWARIRLRVPSDSAHYRVAPRAARPPQLAEDTLTGVLLALFDGTRSVGEVAASFPHKRFDAYERIAELVEARTLRAVDAEELARTALGLADKDLDRAWEVACRGLAMHSQHRSLLEAQVALAERRGEPETAVDGLKRLAHQCWEAGQLDAARGALDKARVLDRGDAFLWERSMELALREGRREDALELGKGLAELFRAPGLHRKACAVFETLLRADPERWELHRERARSLAESGELARAVEGLDAFGRARLGAEDYEAARAVYDEVLALDPGHEEARETLAQIDSGAFERKVLWRRKLVRRALAGGLVAVLLGWLTLEGIARRAYVDALLTISEEGWIEHREHAAAARLLETVAREHPLTTTAWYDVPRHVRGLRSAGGEVDAR